MDLRTELQTALATAYTLERELGRGGMATVFLAHDLKHDRKIALKVLHPELAVALGAERFEREIRTTARLQHPHILPVLDSGAAGGRLFYTMPYVEGESLRDRLRREQQLPIDDALRITREVADALGYAHRQGVVHRDIKPENILLSQGHALVADFGVARALHAAGGDQLTETGMSVGTPAYMSPEQSLADATLDGRSDLYSLGCVLYEMLVGEAPYTGTSAQAIIAKRLREPVPHVRTLRETVPLPVDQALERALAKMPADRFATAEAFAQALSSPSHWELSSPALGTEPHGSTPAGTGRGKWRIAAVASVVLLALAAGMLWRDRRAMRVAAPADATASNRQSGPTRVAVLPFENLGDSENLYFADGITDEVRGKLATLPAMRVVARSSSIEYRHTGKSIRNVGNELGVQYLLTGTVRWEKGSGGTRVRVSPELVDVVTEDTRWQQSFEAPLTDVFRVQADVAAAVAAALGVALGAGQHKELVERPTENVAAYDAYLKGQEASQDMSIDDPGTLRQAAGFYERATALDTTFALAWAQLARARAYLYLLGGSDNRAGRSDSCSGGTGCSAGSRCA
jgi:serine/threonine-protein kinase